MMCLKSARKTAKLKNLRNEYIYLVSIEMVLVRLFSRIIAVDVFNLRWHTRNTGRGSTFTLWDVFFIFSGESIDGVCLLVDRTSH